MLINGYTSYADMTIYRHDTGTDNYVVILNNQLADGTGLFINPCILQSLWSITSQLLWILKIPRSSIPVINIYG